METKEGGITDHNPFSENDRRSGISVRGNGKDCNKDIWNWGNNNNRRTGDETNIGNIELQFTVRAYWIYLGHSEKAYLRNNSGSNGVVNTQQNNQIPKEKKNSGINIISGILMVLLSLGTFFLLPMNDFIQLPESINNLLNVIGFKFGTITLSILFPACLNPVYSPFISQCQALIFVSLVIFVIAFIGVLLIIKGLLYTK